MEPESTLSSKFVGRGEELHLLRTALDESVAGSGRLILLAGEPGIGKTRTAQELTAHAARGGVRVHTGRCHGGEGAPAYWPWIQVVRGYAEECDDNTLRAVMGRGAAEIALAVPA